MKAIIIGIVDDDKIYHYTTRRMIAGLGFQETILPFYNGGEALHYIKENIEFPVVLPDTILLDIDMPYVDGWDFLNEFITLKNIIAKGIVIYMITSSVSELDMEKAHNYQELSGYVIKPVTREQFKDLLSDIIIAA
jgi:two-component system chemotaxis response regulator CheY